MKQKLLNKFWLRVGIIVAIMTTALSGTVWAQSDTKTDVMFAKGFGGYTANSYSAAGTDRSGVANSTNATDVTYAMQVFNGSTGAVRGNRSGASNFSCRNTTTYDGYYISSVSLKVSGGTLDGSTSGRSVVYFGNSAYANPNTKAPSGTATTPSPQSSEQVTLTWTNTDEDASYFILYNLMTANTANSASATFPLTVVWTKKSQSSTPSLSVNPTSIAFGEKTINGSYQETFDVSFANLTENLTVSGFSGVTVSPTTISKDAESPATVTVTYAPTAEGSISGDVTVSNTDDEVSQTVAVTGSAYDPSNQTYYEKVTAAPSDWEGEYIFTGINSDNYYALTGVTSNLGTTAQVAVTENGIASTSTTNAYKVTIAKIDDESYSLYMDGVGYLSYSGSNNQLHASDEFEESTCEWTISFASGVTTITNVGVAGRMLQFNYNNGNPRFACYTSSQVKITLFKLEKKDNSIIQVGPDYTIDVSVSGGGEVNMTSAMASHGTLQSEVVTASTTVDASKYDFAGNVLTVHDVTEGGVIVIRYWVEADTEYDAAELLVPIYLKANPIIDYDGETVNTPNGIPVTVDDSRIKGGAITLESSVTDVATVNGLTITPVAVGSTTITINTAESNIWFPGTATFTLNVTAPVQLTSISLSGTYPTTFEQGDEFSHDGITVTANYEGGSTKDVTADATFSTPDMSSTGTKTITVSYTENEVTKTATYDITVNVKKGSTEGNPYTVAEAIAATPASGTSDNVYIRGIVSAFQNTSIIGDGTNYRYYISDDGTTTNQLLVYKGKGLNNVAFSNADDLQIGDHVVILGGLTTYNSTKEVAANNYIVSLNRPIIPSIDVASTTIDAPVEGVDDTIEVTYNNFTLADAGVQFFEADGVTPATYDWITADINNDNDIEYIVEANTGEARTAYMKVYALDDEANGVYSELITINQAEYVAPVTGKYVKVTSTNDLTDGQYLIVYEDGSVAFDGGLETLDAASNTIDVTLNNNEIDATNATKAAEFTIDVTNGTLKSASGLYIGVSSNSNGLKQTDNADTYTNSFTFDENGNAVISAVFEESSMTMRYNSASNQKRFRYYGSGQQAIQLYKFVDDVESESVTVTSAGYATYCSDRALDFEGTGITAYVGTRSGDKLTFSPITQVPAKTGLLLVCAGGKTADVPVIASAPAVADNCLTGVTKATTLTAADYILNVKEIDGEKKAGFFKAGNYKNLAANRAYIPASVGGSVKSFALDLEDNADGIEETLSDSLLKSENIYNLAGQRLSKMQKGINIVNGKKVLK